jgi:hypothetical protein
MGPALRELRPHVIYGVDVMLMARLLADGYTTEDIVAQWDTLRPATLARYESDNSELTEFLQAERCEARRIQVEFEALSSLFVEVAFFCQTVRPWILTAARLTSTALSLTRRSRAACAGRSGNMRTLPNTLPPTPRTPESRPPSSTARPPSTSRLASTLCASAPSRPSCLASAAFRMLTLPASSQASCRRTQPSLTPFGASFTLESLAQKHPRRYFCLPPAALLCLADSSGCTAHRGPHLEGCASACREIMQRPLCRDESVRLHFVDDRLATLQAIAAQPDLQRWRLYFADWRAPAPAWSLRVDDSMLNALMFLYRLIWMSRCLNNDAHFLSQETQLPDHLAAAETDAACSTCAQDKLPNF